MDGALKLLLKWKSVRLYLENAKFLLSFARQGAAEEAHMDMLDEQIRQLRNTTPLELLGKIFQDKWNQARLLPSLWCPDADIDYFVFRCVS
jgi:hypothetical protein